MILAAGIFLSIGVLIHYRIFTLLSRHNNGAIIDKLFKANTAVSAICHPIVLAYYIFSHLLFPMSDYIGTAGCLFSVHFLDPFVRFYNFGFPVVIALVRYLFVVRHSWVNKIGMKKVITLAIAFSILVPIMMTLSVQFPISETLHFPYHRCIGRFETYFNPLHPGTNTIKLF